MPEFLQSHGSSIQGVFAVDGGDTALLGTSLAKYSLVGKVAAGGFDLEPQTLTAISAGQIDFTIDQSPYLQGFLPTLYMYLWQLSGGLVAPPADGHRPEVRDQEQRGGVHRDADPVRGLDLRAGVHQAHRADLDLIARTRNTGSSRFAAVHRWRRPW